MSNDVFWRHHNSFYSAEAYVSLSDKSIKAVFQWCVFLRTFTYACSIRVNERVYVFWSVLPLWKIHPSKRIFQWNEGFLKELKFWRKFEGFFEHMKEFWRNFKGNKQITQYLTFLIKNRLKIPRQLNAILISRTNCIIIITNHIGIRLFRARLASFISPGQRRRLIYQ